jgi:hypothetical protein
MKNRAIKAALIMDIKLGKMLLFADFLWGLFSKRVITSMSMGKYALTSSILGRRYLLVEFGIPLLLLKPKCLVTSSLGM